MHADTPRGRPPSVRNGAIRGRRLAKARASPPFPGQGGAGVHLKLLLAYKKGSLTLDPTSLGMRVR